MHMVNKRKKETEMKSKKKRKGQLKGLQKQQSLIFVH
jgi:hypothetical protein